MRNAKQVAVSFTISPVRTGILCLLALALPATLASCSRVNEADMRRAILRCSEKGQDDVALAYLSEHAAFARKEATQMLASEKFAERTAALRALYYVGDASSVPEIARVLQGLDESQPGHKELARRGGFALARIGKPAVPTLLELLESPSPFVADAAYAGICQMTARRYPFKPTDDVSARRAQRRAIEEALKTQGLLE